ncbi:hypothetical protein L1987_24540 [Smallanthus sonchifolius]|uniref:Uncharacterized protein n=1 Tax=Smallanthus sonchifolius TaxID=185202 RepID=A0ACB9IM62_9ASTR|nr:hypothetical protein L1987_24540 [Smallanthus sonchifolius]
MEKIRGKGEIKKGSRKSLGKTFKVTLDGRIQAIQEESQQFLNPNEVVPPESNEPQRLLRISKAQGIKALIPSALVSEGPRSKG